MVLITECGNENKFVIFVKKKEAKKRRKAENRHAGVFPMCNGRFSKMCNGPSRAGTVEISIYSLTIFINIKSFCYLLKYNKISTHLGCYSIRRSCTSSLRLFWFMESKMSTITNE
jgi:hypothetical protein